MSISIEPPIELPSENDQLYYPGYENAGVLQLISAWQESYNKKNRLNVWGENIKGESVLLCRYLTPIKPPAEVVNLGSRDPFAIEKAARFVSLIPYMDDDSLMSNMADMYCTCQEFLDLGAGDYEEHAILLANYFQYIDDIQDKGKFTNYIVFGEGMPEGNTVYVMRRFSEEHARTVSEHKHSVELWQPLTGQCYFFARKTSSSDSYTYVRSNDPMCPLRKIHCVVSGKNIWQNIQQYSNPVLLDFDLTNTKAWKPLFTSLQQCVNMLGPMDANGQIETCQVLQANSQLLCSKPQENIQ